ncbi:nitroreductase family protein [Clostridium cylindrosporum]|uniref:Putative NADH dehydrogenase/NAD(P)H nitroreductase n=1 Tax=Clostridium cylindrosporum DSM 605 TaxID=1121307 RepID=A0A0J8DCE2_CLOCY|nr:nitroreductase family protein [Clostridium cylindrosporum]KMT21923.1 putative NADH dehydrogenase/NAD(P)H nitroreductase [Clostridium cylindrosporum DSM 605]
MIELLKSRRSIRKYQDKEIEMEKVDTLLKSALLAPSSRSKRPWEFIAVTDKELLKKLSQSKRHGSQFLEEAPLCIVVIADTERSDVWIEDASIAASIIHITAHSMGLGSCWIQTRQRFSEEGMSEDYVKNLFNLPDTYAVECIIAVGYPAEDKKAYEDNDLLYDKVHFNGFTNR